MAESGKHESPINTPTGSEKHGSPLSSKAGSERRESLSLSSTGSGKLDSLSTTGSEKYVMVIAIDDSDHSFYALEWTLNHFFVPSGELSPFKLVVVHSKPSPSSAMALAGAGPGAVAIDVQHYVNENLTKTADRVLERASLLCSSKSVNDVIFEVQDGDPKHVLCDAVDRYSADMLVVGSHGYGSIKRALLGSVSDYCAHRANCSVTIVKLPKTKN